MRGTRVWSVGFRWALVLGLVWAAGAPSAARAGDSSATLRVLPAAGAYAVGAIFTVEVQLEAVAGLYGADIHLEFDPARLTILDAAPGLPGVQVTPRSDLLAPDLVLHREADNGAGTIWYVVSQLAPSAPVTGTGVLFSFQAQGLSSGPAGITITSALLGDHNGAPLPVLTIPALMTITAGAPVSLYLPLVNTPAATRNYHP